jgi:hypothetical protein
MCQTPRADGGVARASAAVVRQEVRHVSYGQSTSLHVATPHPCQKYAVDTRDALCRAELLRNVLALKLRVVAEGNFASSSSGPWPAADAHAARSQPARALTALVFRLQGRVQGLAQAQRKHPAHPRQHAPASIFYGTTVPAGLPAVSLGPSSASNCCSLVKLDVPQVLRVERSFLRSVLSFWEQITQELQQGRNKASRWNSERERLRTLILQVRQRVVSSSFGIVVLSQARCGAGGGQCRERKCRSAHVEQDAEG